MVTETYKDARTGEMRTRSYVRGRPLGKGGFAVVFSMQDPSTGESFAAKVVAKSTLEKDRARQKILTEIRIHRSVDNAHVVKFKKCFEDTNNVYILMELCSDKTLADVVKRRGRLTERECAPYLREIVAAVAHLHRERNVIHRDLKLGNVFLTPAGLDEALSNDEGGGPGSDADLGGDPRFGTRLKIGDFGLACVLETGGGQKAKHHLRHAQLHRAGDVGGEQRRWPLVRSGRVVDRRDSLRVFSGNAAVPNLGRARDVQTHTRGRVRVPEKRRRIGGTPPVFRRPGPHRDVPGAETARPALAGNDREPPDVPPRRAGVAPAPSRGGEENGKRRRRRRRVRRGGGGKSAARVATRRVSARGGRIAD